MDGLLRRHATLPATAFIEAPEHLNASQAATLPCAAVTNWRISNARGSRHVLVGVAVFAVQFSIPLLIDEKLAKIRDLGADNTVNYREHPQWSDRVNDLLGGESIDLAIELGGAETLAQSLNCIRWGASRSRSAGRYL